MKHDSSVSISLASLCGVLLCVLALIAPMRSSAGPATLKVGDPFPKLSEFGLEGALPENLEGKVVLVDFWASWCGPCKESFAVMTELMNKYGKNGFVIIAVSVDEKRSDMDGFLKDHPAGFPIVRDAKNKLVKKVNVPSMPTSFILDASGKVAAVHAGFHGADTRKNYIQEIESLLSASKAK